MIYKEKVVYTITEKKMNKIGQEQKIWGLEIV